MIFKRKEKLEKMKLRCELCGTIFETEYYYFPVSKCDKCRKAIEIKRDKEIEKKRKDWIKERDKILNGTK